MRDLTNTNKITMSLFQFTCAYGGNMVIIKPRFLKIRLGRQLLAAILGPPLRKHMTFNLLLCHTVNQKFHTVTPLVCGQGNYLQFL
jgi:hypothetical protein